MLSRIITKYPCHLENMSLKDSIIHVAKTGGISCSCLFGFYYVVDKLRYN